MPTRWSSKTGGCVCRSVSRLIESARALILFVLLLSPCGVACSAADPSGESPNSAAAGAPFEPVTAAFEGFSAHDLDVIRTQLGPLPDGVPGDPTNEYATRDDAAQLGRSLFFDAGFSSTGEVSCATCHDPKTGFQDARGAPTSLGVDGSTERHAPSLLNAAWGDALPRSEGVSQFWDGRVDSLWSQALAPPESPVEMGSTRGQVVLRLIQRYRSEYEAVFGSFPKVLFAGNGEPVFDTDARPGSTAWHALPQTVQEAITRAYVNFGKAIAAYESHVTCSASRFDAFWSEIAGGADDSTLLNQQEKLGLLLFVRETGQFARGYGRCIECHKGPNFSDWKFHNIDIDQSELGAPIPASDDGRAHGLTELAKSEFHCASAWSDQPDKATCARVPAPTKVELGQFKTPGLRCIAQAAPYMHTGSFEKLSDVVDHYAKGGARTGFVGQSGIAPLALTTDEREAIVAFLRALSGDTPQWTLQAP